MYVCMYVYMSINICVEYRKVVKRKMKTWSPCVFSICSWSPVKRLLLLLLFYIGTVHFSSTSFSLYSRIHDRNSNNKIIDIFYRLFLATPPISKPPRVNEDAVRHYSSFFVSGQLLNSNSMYTNNIKEGGGDYMDYMNGEEATMHAIKNSIMKDRPGKKVIGKQDTLKEPQILHRVISTPSSSLDVSYGNALGQDGGVPST